MKYLIPFIALCIACAACNSSSDKEAEGDMDQTESADSMQNKITFSEEITSVDGIRAEAEKTMQAINSGAMDSTSFTYDCNGEKSGSVTYYHNDSTTRMIERNYAEYSHREGTERYFVSDRKPYFVYQKTADWSFISDGETRDNVKEKRFYVLGDTLAQCLTKEYVLESDAPDNPDPEEIESVPGQCPPISGLMDPYELLLSHRDTTGAIECLQKE